MKMLSSPYVFKKAYASVILLCFTRIAGAAPCCGGGAAIPSLLTGDDRSQLAVSVSQAQVIGDAPVDGMAIFRADGDLEQTQTFRFDGSYLFTDQLQAGVGIPIVNHMRDYSGTSASSTGFGDIQMDLAYEFLPERNYSVWKPHGYLFLESTFPTSPSVYDASAPFLIDARGRGFFSAGVGVALLKYYKRFDFIFITEGHRSFERNVAAPDGTSLDLTPGYGGSVLLGAGWSLRAPSLRLGVSLSPVYEDGIGSTGSIDSQSSSQLVWNTTLQAGYLLSLEWSASLSYTDQTLLGPAHNVTLSRSLMVLAQKRWQL